MHVIFMLAYSFISLHTPRECSATLLVAMIIADNELRQKYIIYSLLFCRRAREMLPISRAQPQNIEMRWWIFTPRHYFEALARGECRKVTMPENTRQIRFGWLFLFDDISTLLYYIKGRRSFHEICLLVSCHVYLCVTTRERKSDAHAL